MYTISAMKYIQKTIVASLIVTLVSFAGGLCTHPMMAEASASGMGMETDHALSLSYDTVSVQPETSSAIDVCIIDCITTVPQVTTTKKAVVDSALQVSLITPLALFRGPSSVGMLGSDDTFGISPPSPDILFSVMKRE